MENKRLFLSYGHPEAEICRKICIALTEAGYEVWMDESKLKAGDDWREKIFDGVRSSNGVIACLSGHSVRNPGVCRDELSIAVGIRGGNIKTILLEDEAKVKAPAELCHRQWLDMHDWREWKARGEDVFEAWFQEKMSYLIEMVKSENEFTGEIESLRRILHPNSSRTRQSALLAKPFYGREWLTEEIIHWMDRDDAGRMLMIYGDAGIGKSAFMAQYAYHNARVVGGIFCERENTNLNRPENIIRTIAFQLACRLPVYRKALMHILGTEVDLGQWSASELFDLILADPLMNLYIDGGQETLCFVIDALDECGDEDHNEMAKVLSLYVDRLPVWLKFVVSSREVSSVTSVIGRASSVSLHGREEENMRDIRTYFEDALKGELRDFPYKEDVLNRLAASSRGIFLYAYLVVNCIREGWMKPWEQDRLPDGLSEIYMRWFEGSFPDQNLYEDHFRRLISVMLAVPGGLPESEIGKVLRIDENERNDLLRRIRVLLERHEDRMGYETITFSHQYISEWIVREEAGRFRCSPEAGKAYLADFLSERCRMSLDEMSDWEILSLGDCLGGRDCFKKREELAVDPRLTEMMIGIGDRCALEEKIDLAQSFYEEAQFFLQSASSGKRKRREHQDRIRGRL